MADNKDKQEVTLEHLREIGALIIWPYELKEKGVDMMMLWAHLFFQDKESVIELLKKAGFDLGDRNEVCWGKSGFEIFYVALSETL